MGKQEIRSDRAQKPSGPYAQGLRVGSRVYVAGQGPHIPETNAIPEGFEAQALQVMKNVQSVLESAGVSMDAVVKSTVHLADLADFEAFNAIYASFFTPPAPVRTTVGSTLLFGMRVEVDVEAEVE